MKIVFVIILKVKIKGKIKMAFEFYGNVGEAADLAGSDVAEGDLIEEMQKTVNRWIDSKLKINGFNQSGEITEYYTMEDSGIIELMLDNCPVIDSTLTLYDDENNDSPTTVSDTCYYLDLTTGIIQLLINKSLTGSDVIVEFTKGINSVKVVYKYGYESIPGDIAVLATTVLAKWGKLKNQQTEADGMKSIKIGDYTESYDMSFLNIKSEFDETIKDLISYAIEKYGKFV